MFKIFVVTLTNTGVSNEKNIKRFNDYYNSVRYDWM